MREKSAANLISVVIPVYNEQENIQLAYQAVKSVFERLLPNYEYEIIFTDNHSEDGTYAAVQKIARQDGRVKIARFARNYGFNKSILAGFRLANGEAAIQLDCDLQDTPELFPRFIQLWEQGHDVVVGVREKREESRWLQRGRHAFYKFLNQISEDNLVVDGGEFRLLDRSILDQLRTISEAMPYVRGLTSTLAANQATFPYERTVRRYGQSKFPLRRLMVLAIEGIVSHSTVPLRLASLTGLTIASLTSLLALYFFVAKLFFNVSWPAGFATEVVLILFGISINAIFLGIIGEYVGRIYLQVRVRPNVVIEKSENILPQHRESHEKTRTI